MLAPATRLEAVNLMLDTIGQAPVNTLSGQVSVDVKRAENLLDHISREVQSRGCSFNAEDDYPLTPTTAGEVLLPSNLIAIDLDPATYGPASYDVVIRGNRLYNKVTHSYSFTEPLKADVVLLLDFEELPQYARNYVVVRAARKFQDSSLGSETTHRFSEDDEITASRDFRRAEAEQADRSILTPYYANRTLRTRSL
jgi:hypothetical protein